MSISATLCGLLVALLRLIKRIPRRVIAFLWLIPLLRMCCPVGLSGKYSLMSLLTRLSSKEIMLGKFDFSTINHVTAAESYFPLSYKTTVLQNIFQVAGAIWLAVSAVLLIFATISYYRAMKETERAKHDNGNIYYSAHILSPAVYGIFKPKILLPKSTDKKALPFILLHENMHIKRKDNLRRLFAAAVTCLHWFNPFCLLFLKLFFADSELACDEAVIARLNKKEQKQYALTVLSAAEHIAALTSPFGGAKTKTRITRILTYKKLTAVSSVYLLIFTAAVLYTLLMN